MFQSVWSVVLTIPPPNDHTSLNQNSSSFGTGVTFQNVSLKVFRFLAYFNVMVFLEPIIYRYNSAPTLFHVLWIQLLKPKYKGLFFFTRENYFFRSFVLWSFYGVTIPKT